MLSMKKTGPFVLCIALAACGGDDRHGDAEGSGGTAGGTALPTPEARGGSVTGMPNTLPTGTTAPIAAPPPEVVAEPVADAPIDDAVANGEDAAPASAVEPGSDAAVQVVRDYYAAINRHDYASAHAMWRGNGQASGKSTGDFAQGFAQTSGVSVEIGKPGPIEAGAGQRNIEIPVSLIARQTDGSEQRYRGRYVMQRTVVDGASDDQRAWRIAGASLSQVP